MTKKNSGEIAYEMRATEIEQVPAADVLPVNIDVLAAITKVLGSLPELQSVRAKLEKNLPAFDLGRLDKLESYALALNHVHACWRVVLQPERPARKRIRELVPLRNRLRLSARALVAHGLLDGKRLRESQGASGHQALAGEVLALVNMFKENWGVLEGKTAMGVEDMNRGAQCALDLLSELRLRDRASAAVGKAALRRQQAFSLFVSTYNDTRGAIQYLWGSQQCNQIAPSLYSGQGTRRHRMNRTRVLSQGGTSTVVLASERSAVVVPTLVV